LFYEAMFSLHPAATLSITPEDYKKNCTFFAWSLTTENDLDDSDNISLIRRGHARLDLRFKAATTEQQTLLIYAHFPEVAQIDANREVMIEHV
jgi:hypothetical protein